MSKTYEAEFTVVRETDNAILLRTEDGEEVWVPFSQIDEIHRDRNGMARVVMSQWIAKQKGLA